MRISSSDMDDVSSPMKVTPTPSRKASIQPQETLSPQESLSKQSLSIEWTDEKHSLYLKSMEATFVNQLYNSLWLSQKQQPLNAKPSRQMHAGARVPSGQFKVVRGGCWKMINFKKGEPQLEKADDSCAISTNQWIRRYRTGCIKNQMVKSSISPVKDALKNHATTYSEEPMPTSSASADTKQLHIHNPQMSLHDAVDSSAEMSGQNFVDDEDVEVEKRNRSCSRANRMKSSIVAPSRCDQVMSVSGC